MKEPGPGRRVNRPLTTLRLRRSRPAPNNNPASALVGSGTAVQVRLVPDMVNEPMPLMLWPTTWILLVSKPPVKLAALKISLQVWVA